MIWAALTPESRARTQLASFGIMPEASLSPRTMASASPSDHLGDEGVGVGVVLVEAVHIGEEDDLVGADGRSDVAGSDVGVHVVAAAVLADGDGGDDGDVVVGHQVLDELAC